MAELWLNHNQLTTFTVPDDLTNLDYLRLDNNQLTTFTVPDDLTSLEALYLHDNQLTTLTLPDGMASLRDLRLSNNQLTTLTLPDGLTNLQYLELHNNPLESLRVPEGMDIENLEFYGFSKSAVTFYDPATRETIAPPPTEPTEPAEPTEPTEPEPPITEGTLLITGTNSDGSAFRREIDADAESLSLSRKQLTALSLPTGLTNLAWLYLDNNQLPSLTLPAGLAKARGLYLNDNQLTSLTLPHGLTNLWALYLNNNQLTSLTLPEDLTSLRTLDLSNNSLTNLALPAGLTSLRSLILNGNNHLKSLCVPKGVDVESLNLQGFPKSEVTFCEPMIGTLTLPDASSTNFRRLSLNNNNLLEIVRIAGGGVQIHWRGGTLQSTTNLRGEWEAVAPSRFSREGVLPIPRDRKGAEFFRLKLAK